MLRATWPHWALDLPQQDDSLNARHLVRASLFRIQGWVAGAACGYWVTDAIQELLRWRLFDTAAEGLTGLLATTVGWVAGLGIGLLLHRLPRRMSVLRLRGKIDGNAADAILAFGAGASVLWLAHVWFSIGTPYNYYRLMPIDSQEAAIAMLAALIGYALPWLVMRRPPQRGRTLWLVVPDRSGMTGPLSVVVRGLVDALARRWSEGPVNLMLDRTIDAGGSHAIIADDAGRLDALFPSNLVEIADWQQVLSPPDRWTSLAIRELHPTPALMVPALRRYMQPDDAVVLVTRSSSALLPWRDTLRHSRCVVAWLGPQTARTIRIAGLAAIPMRADDLVRRPNVFFERVQRIVNEKPAGVGTQRTASAQAA